MPKRLLKLPGDSNEQSKYFMYILLNNGFEALSMQYISKIGATAIKFKHHDIIKHKMGALKLESYLINSHNNYKIKKYGEKSCVLDYIWNEVRFKKGFKKYDYEKLKDELYSYVENPP